MNFPFFNFPYLFIEHIASPMKIFIILLSHFHNKLKLFFLGILLPKEIFIVAHPLSVWVKKITKLKYFLFNAPFILTKFPRIKLTIFSPELIRP